MSRFSADEKRREALREVKMREQVYPRRIEKGALEEDEAARRIAIMTEIAADYAKLTEKDRLL